MTSNESNCLKEQFISRIRDCFSEHLKVHPEPKAVVAISGGPDSTALLVALSELASELDISIRAIHVNHQLRSQESDMDEEFCRNLCKTLALDLDVRSLEFSSAPGKLPSEEELREARYREFIDFCRSIDSNLLVTGHTQDDQLETILFRLFRGSSAKGLEGMAPLRILDQDHGLLLFRPMLSLEKTDCLRFLAESEISAREDSTNQESHYDRNYIRHHIVPKIEERFSQWNKSLLRFQNMVMVENDYFDKVIADLLAEVAEVDGDKTVWRLSKVKDVHLALLRRMVAWQLRGLSVEPSFERVTAITDMMQGFKSDSAITLSPFCEVRLQQETLCFNRLDPDAENEAEVRYQFLAKQFCTLHLPAGDRKVCNHPVLWLNKSLKISAWPENEVPGNYPSEKSLKALVGTLPANNSLCVRIRKPGDLIQPFGMQELVRLKKYLHTHKSEDLPSFQQNSKTLVVLANQDEVLWIPGVGMSEKLRVKGRKPDYIFEWLDLAADGPVLA